MGAPAVLQVETQVLPLLDKLTAEAWWSGRVASSKSSQFPSTSLSVPTKAGRAQTCMLTSPFASGVHAPRVF